MLWPVATETAALDAAFTSMVLGGRAARTLAKYHLPFLKLALWLAFRWFALNPPQPRDVCICLVFVTVTRRNRSAAASAVAALQYVAWLNGWESVGNSAFVCAPLDATSRALAVPTRKAPAIEACMVVAIV